MCPSFPVGGDVTELTLTGFKYPLTGHHLTVTDCGLTLSNEITEDSGTVTYDRGESFDDTVERLRAATCSAASP